MDLATLNNISFREGKKTLVDARDRDTEPLHTTQPHGRNIA